MYMHHIFFSLSPADIHLGHFHFLATVSSLAVNIDGKESYDLLPENLWGIYLRVVGLGHWVVIWGKVYTDFHHGCSSLHTHRQCAELFSHVLGYLLPLVCLVAIQTQVE